MTKREIQITQALLDVLHETDGAQLGEITLHREVTLIVECSATEFAAVLKQCDTRKWLTAVPARTTGTMKYNINDAGEAARLEF
jgi:hypothetical protein